MKARFIALFLVLLTPILLTPTVHAQGQFGQTGFGSSTGFGIGATAGGAAGGTGGATGATGATGDLFSGGNFGNLSIAGAALGAGGGLGGGGLGGFGGGLGGFGGGLGGFGGGFGGGLGGIGRTGGLGGQFGQNNQQNDSTIRAAVTIGFDYALPANNVRATTITERLSRLPVNSQIAGIQVQIDGNTAILTGQVESKNDAEVAARLMLLEPGIYKIENNLTYPGQTNEPPSSPQLGSPTTSEFVPPPAPSTTDR